MNVQDAAIQILKDAGKPLHAKEIAEQITAAGLWSSDGKTSEATVSARLYSDIKRPREATVKKYLTVLSGPGCTKVGIRGGGQAND